jgi:ribulose 1,5-bisphosphate carboxylase large subunit-like protein
MGHPMGSAAGAKALTDFVRLYAALKRRSTTVQQALVSFSATCL